MQALNNCLRDVQRQYNELIIKQNINEMIAGSTTAKHYHQNITPLQLSSSLNSVSSTMRSSTENDDDLSLEFMKDNNDSDSVESEVPSSLIN
jgi:hypothetical protein